MNFVKYINNIDDYELLSDYKNMTTKVLVKHNECGREYEVSPSSFKTKGQRCVKCSQKAKMEKSKLEYIQVIEGSNEYKMLEEYKGNHTKIMIKHLKCGHEYKVAPSKFRYANRRCPNCNKGVKMTIKDFHERVRKIHKEEYEVVGEYQNSNTKIEVKHRKCNRIFQVTPHNFIKSKRATGCPSCYSSHGEKEVRDVLTRMDIIFDEQKTFEGMELDNKLKADFYLPKFNAIIEYNGKQHYEVVEHFGGEEGFYKTQLRDKIKKEFCVKNNIIYIEIPYFIKDVKKEISNQLGMTNSLTS